MMVRRRRKDNTAWYAAALAIAVLAFLIMRGDIRFLRLAVISVPQEGVTYDFDDGTFQGWTVTSNYITVENGVVAAGAPGAGGGSGTLTYNFDYDLEGWSNKTYTAGYKPFASVSIQDMVARLYVKSEGRNYETTESKAQILREFDFTDVESITLHITYRLTGDQNIRSPTAGYADYGLRRCTIQAYESVNGRPGDFIKKWVIPESGWTTISLNLTELSGRVVFLYVEAYAKVHTYDPHYAWQELLIDRLEIETVLKPFTAEGYLEAEFSFTHGFEGATIKQILLKVDYASEAEWTGFWGVRILDSGVEVASFQFTKGYMAWNTFSRDIKQYVAGKTVTIRIGGVITSAARWFIDNVRLEYVLEYPFLTLQLQPSYPANSWGNVTVLVGGQQSGVLVTAEIEGRGFQAVSDQNGVAVINVLMPPAGSYPIRVFATNPEDGQLYQVNGTVTVLPVIQARIEAEPSQHYDTPITFIVKTSDPDGNLPVDADTLSVEILMGGVRLTPTIERLATGEYQVSFTASQEGTASVTVTPLKSGYHSVPDGVEITILQPRLVLTVNIPQEATAPGQVEVYVKTTTPDGELIDSTVTASLKHPDGTSRSYTASRVTRGTYLLVLNLPEAGVYQITVQASNDLYGSSSGTYTLTAKAQAVPFLGDVRVIGGAAAAAIAAVIAVLKRRGTI